MTASKWPRSCRSEAVCSTAGSSDPIKFTLEAPIGREFRYANGALSFARCGVIAAMEFGYR
jgi:hypothetical protein